MTPDFLSIFREEKAVQGESFEIGWQSPSNIALVKYWGKKDGQLPVSPSLSMTLSESVSRTRVYVSFDRERKGLISVNGNFQHPFMPKMQYLLDWLIQQIPELRNITIQAETSNSFPHSTGIASSASGLSAFALCLGSILQRIFQTEMSDHDFRQMASIISRMGSGSACRSVYGGFTLWGETAANINSSDEYAVQVNDKVHPELLSLRDAILIVSSEKKSLSSTKGHQTMNTHPYLSGRIKQANLNLEEILKAMKVNDFEKLAEISENEALSLHALMMSADPGTILMQAGTIEIIQHVRAARKKGLPVFFTLDAGANVHVIYPTAFFRDVEKFIAEELKPCCENGQILFDQCGNGPVQLDEKNSILF